MSASGHAAHPDEIIASCQALQKHLQKMQEDAEATLQKWQDEIAAKELAEKRRVAPGWLDREEKILQPQRRPDQSAKGEAGMDSIIDLQDDNTAASNSRDGEELDLAFGGMQLKS